MGGGACNSAPRLWIVAACEGLISLFEKNMQGMLAPKLQGEQSVFASLEAFQKSIGIAEDAHAFDQLIIVGSGNDIAWVHASLPAPVTRHIVAEVEYPLLPMWFKEATTPQLTRRHPSIYS